MGVTARQITQFHARSKAPKTEIWEAPYRLTWDRVVWRPAQVSTVFSWTRRIHFSTLRTPIFLLMYAMLWCKHSTVAKGRPGFPQISVLGPILTYLRRGSLQAHTGTCDFCTEEGNTFLVSLYPYLPFDIYIALVQTQHHVKGRPRFPQISVLSPILTYMIWGHLQAQTGKCGFATAGRRHFWALYTRSFLLMYAFL